MNKMDNSLITSIEQIKQQEQDNEIKCIEKRELEAKKNVLHRAIREALAQTDIAKQEYAELLQKTDKLRTQLEIENVHHDALSQQVAACTKELHELRAKSDQGITEVWQLRSSLSAAVTDVSAKCDIWALLMKPLCTETILRPTVLSPEAPQVYEIHEKRLKDAIAKREQVQIDHGRLLCEPDTGEEYKRIRNALRYSLEMLSKLNK